MAAALAAAALAAPRDLMLYNHSPSVPEGIYIRTSAPVAVGAFVTVRARDGAPEAAHQRRFEDDTDRFIKRVAAAAGARVCGDGQRLTISGDDIIVVGAEDRTRI
jgi:type IV secretory pathway protease TraF